MVFLSFCMLLLHIVAVDVKYIEILFNVQRTRNQREEDTVTDSFDD